MAIALAATALACSLERTDSKGGTTTAARPRTATTAAPRAHEPAKAITAPRVVVVGGGIAGLVTAYELEKRGISTHLLEASDVLGGRVQTAYYGDGLHAEYGMQEMWQGNPLLDIARELRVSMDGEPEPPYSSVLIDDRLYPYIQDTTEEYFATFLSPAEQKALGAWLKSAKALRAEAEKEGLRSARVRALQSESFAAWIQKSKLPKKGADWIKLTLECELASTWDSFSALAGILEFGIFFGGDVPNFHVRGGNTRLIRAIAEATLSPKTLSAVVTAVKREKTADGRIAAHVTYVKDNKIQSIDAERVVLAVPFVRLHQIHMDPPLSEDRWRAIQTLGLGQYTVVHFLISKEAAALWMIDGKSPLPVLTDGPLGVIYGVQGESPPEQPLDVFALLVYGMHARLFHMVPREVKVRALLDELDKLWPGFSKHVRASHVYTYHPASLAVWPPGRSPIDEGSELLRQPDFGAYLVGDYTLGSHSDSAARSGLSAAQRIAEELARR